MRQIMRFLCALGAMLAGAVFAKKYYFRDVVMCIGFFAGVGAVLASVGVLLVFWCNNVYFWVVCCALLCGTVVCRKFVRRARYQHRVKQGVDYCIKQECLDAVPFVLKHYARQQTCISQARFNVAPRFDCFAATYSHLRFRGLLFSRRLFRELEFLDGNDNAYRAICREDNESYYCVRMQANDERVYRLELEVSKDPYPYASDIEHYIALRIGNMGIDAALKGLSMREMSESGSSAVASKTVRHTVAARITAIETKKPQLKQVAKSARLGKGAVERMGRDKR